MKAVTLLKIFVLVLSVTSFVACVHEPDLLIDDSTGGGGGGGENPFIDDCHPDTVYFENDILPILQSNCAYSGCHGDGSAEDGVDLETYSSIINTGDVDPFDPDGSKLFEVLTETGNDLMPPADDGGPLTAEQISLIETWINQGALNNGCTGCGNADNVTWSLTIQPLIENNCQGCHSGSNPDGSIALESYDDVLVIVQNGSLMGTVNAEPGYEPMPYQSYALPDCKIDQLQNWVDQGAPEN